MKLHCNRPALATAFQIVGGVISTRTPKEILKNVKLTVGDGKAVLTGTDQEVGIHYEIADVQTDSFGEALLPTSRMTSILREVQDDDIEIEVTDSAIWVRSGHSEFRLSKEDPAEFPPVPTFTDTKYHVIPGSMLKEMIRRTNFATDPESHRYALGGVLMELKLDALTMAATDSRRLAVVKTVCTAQGLEKVANEQPVVPSKALSLIERSLTGDSEEALLAMHNNDVLVQCGQSTIYARLVEGRFPPYAKFLAIESAQTIDLIAGPFYSAVRQAQIVTSEETRGVDFTFADGVLRLTSKATDIGESKIELPISYDGPEIVITFEPKYIADFLRVLEPETILHLGLSNSESPAVFRTEDQYTYVVMPLSRQ